MKKYLVAAFSLALVCAALADAITDRQALMKLHGKSMGELSPMVKGEKAFDAALALEALTALKASAETLDVDVHWPEGSLGGNTESSPRIREDLAGFTAALDKFKADTAAAVATPPQDAEALQASVGAIGADCGACHRAYRL